MDGRRMAWCWITVAVVCLPGRGLAGSPAPFYIYANDAGRGQYGMSALWDYDLSFGRADVRFRYPGVSDTSVDYRDTTHPEAGHRYDLRIPAGVAWQPASQFNSGHPPGSGVGPFGFDMSGYTWLTFDLWTAHPANDYDLRGEYLGNINHGTGDQAVPAYVWSLTAVPGVAPLRASTWNRVRIPLAYLGHLGVHAAYKFYIRDNSNNTHAGSGASEEFYLDNVGLLPGRYAWVYDGGAVSGWTGRSRGWRRDPSAPLDGWADATPAGASVDYRFDPRQLTAALNQGDASSLNGLETPGYGNAIVSTRVIRLSVTAAGGMWKVMRAGGFDVHGYAYLTFGALPTQARHAYRVQFYSTQGKPVGRAVSLTPDSPYTSKDWGGRGGFWTVYCIPLSAFASLPPTIGGLSIEDAGGRSPDTLFLTAVGFFQ